MQHKDISLTPYAPNIVEDYIIPNVVLDRFPNVDAPLEGVVNVPIQYEVLFSSVITLISFCVV
jgi:hypothetical protein